MVYWYFGWCFRESFSIQGIIFIFNYSLWYNFGIWDGIFDIWDGIFGILWYIWYLGWYIWYLVFAVFEIHHSMIITIQQHHDDQDRDYGWCIWGSRECCFAIWAQLLLLPCLLFICPVNLALVCSKVVQWRCKTLHLLPNSEEWHPEQAWKHPRARGAGHIPPGATERRQDRARNCTRRPTAVTGCAQPQSLPVCSW